MGYSVYRFGYGVGKADLRVIRETPYRASKGHIGVYLASHISECLHEYGIQGKVCSLSDHWYIYNLTELIY